MTTRIYFIILAAAIPLVPAVQAQTKASVTFNVNHAKACVKDFSSGTDGCLAATDPNNKFFSIKVQSQSGPNVVFLVTDNTNSSPITATVTISAPTTTYTGTEVKGPIFAFFVPDSPPGGPPTGMYFKSSWIKSIPNSHVDTTFDTYFNADLDFTDEPCAGLSCPEFAMPITTADQRHEPSGPRLLVLTGEINFQDIYYAFTIYYDYAPAADQIKLISIYPPQATKINAGDKQLAPFYALVGYDIEKTDVGEIHLELRDTHDTLIAASPSRRICVAGANSCPGTGLSPRVGVIGEGTFSDPYVRITPADYLVPAIPDGVSALSLQAVLTDPKTGDIILQSLPAFYPVVPAAQPIVELGTRANGQFVAQTPDQLLNVETLGGQNFSTGAPAAVNQIRGAIQNLNLKDGDFVKLEILVRFGIGPQSAGKYGPYQILSSKNFIEDGEFFYPVSGFLVDSRASSVQLVTRANFPDGSVSFSPVLTLTESTYVAPPQDFKFQRDRTLTAGTDESFTFPLEGRNPNEGSDRILVSRCDVLVLADRSEILQNCIFMDDLIKAGTDIGTATEKFTVHIPLDSELPLTGSVLKYCTFFRVTDSSARSLTAMTPRFCNPVQQPKKIDPTTLAINWVGTKLKNIKGHAGEQIAKKVGFDFLEGAGNPLIHVQSTDGKKPGAADTVPLSRLGSTLKSRDAAASPATPDLLGLRGTIQFDPSFPAGTFSADLVMSYNSADFPDDPQFDPAKLQIVAVDPATGALTPLVSQVDTNAGTVTASIDGLAPVYGLAQVGPFAQRNLGAAALTAGGGDNAVLFATNTGASAPVKIEVYGGTPGSDSKTVGASQQLSGTVNGLISAESDASWLLTRAPLSVFPIQSLNAGRGFDLLDLQRAMPYAIFPAVEQNDLVSTEFHIANPNAFSSTASLFLFGPDGTQIDSVQFQIDPKERRILTFEYAFPAAQTPFSGYAVLSADESLNASAVIRSSVGLAVYNGVGPTVSPSHILVPYLGPDTANLYLVNNGGSDLHFTATAYDQTGTRIGSPVTATLGAYQQYTAALSQMFPASGPLPRGSIAIDTDSTALSGELVFHASAWQKLAALPIGADAQTSTVIPYQASSSSYATTVNIASAGQAATATVTVFGPDGTKIGSGQLQAPANGSASGSVSTLVSAASSLIGGYLRIGSTQPVVAFAELTSAGTTDFAVIAAQPAAGSPIGGGGTATISVTAPNLDFGTVNTGSTKDLTLTIASTGTSTLSVTPGFTPNPPFSIVSSAGSLSVNAGTQQTLTVRFSPTAAGAQTGTLTLTTNDLAHPTLTYKFTGTGATASGSPTANVTVPNTDFGTVNTGSTKDLTLTVANTGTATLSVTPSFAPNPPFSIVSPAGSLSVNAGTQLTLTVRFSPTAAGAQTGTLTLTTNDLAHPTLTYKFTGTGAAGSGGNGACSSAPSNLVGWWTGDGTPNDSIGGVNGTLQGGASFAAGKVGQAFQFDGVNGYVSLGNASKHQFTSALTIEAWINPKAAPPASGASSGTNMAAVLTKWAENAGPASDSDSYGLWFRNDNGSLLMFSAIHQAGGSEPNVRGGSIPLNTWSHVAMTFDSATGNFILYVNGQPVASAVTPGAVMATSKNVLIGREDSSLPRPFNGLIDEVSVYNRALSAAEIQTVFNAGANGKCKTAGSATTDVTLQVDGGVFNSDVGYPTGASTAYFVNRLTPPSYPATLKAVQIYFSSRPDGVALNSPITLFAGTNPGGSSALSFGGPSNLYTSTVIANDTFITFTLPAPLPTISSGDFVVGFRVPNPPNFYPADLDQLTPSQKRSYSSTDGVNFTSLDSIAGLAGNLAIRAVVTVTH